MIFEFMLAVFAAIAMGRFAETDRGEGLKWGFITFGLCIATLFLVPLPMLRIGLACAAAFGLMTVMKPTFY